MNYNNLNDKENIHYHNIVMESFNTISALGIKICIKVLIYKYNANIEVSETRMQSHKR